METKTAAKNIVTGLMATAVIVGGLVVGFKDKTTPKMTYEEAQMLIKVYDHELKKSTDKNLKEVTKNNVIQKLNDKFSAREIKSEEILDGENVNPADYKILKGGLMQKSK